MDHGLDSATPRHCSDCATVTLFAPPPCEDGHGLDCPDLMCLDCGAAVALGVPAEAVAGWATAA